MSCVRLCLVIHNHQPIGNFEYVIQRAYEDSYLPFLDVFEGYSDLKLSLHTSGPLMLWMQANHPEYVGRVAALVAAGRIEILGGPMYEPIMPMLPSRDRVGQMQVYNEYLNGLFGTDVKGMWMPERVWESSLTPDIVRAGIGYTVLDDFHFKSAGWSDEQLLGSYLTEDNGSVLQIFPGSEILRYLVPFAPPQQTIDYARRIANAHDQAVLVFGDDGEKFGTWPDTKSHVYDQGWLRRFFDALADNQDWLTTSTLAEAVEEHPPIGKIYLPDCSYREMTEWSLPAQQQEVYDEVTQELAEHPRWADIGRFIRGGNWRNFRVRYEEANEMYARMMQISQRLETARRISGDAELLGAVEDHLYRSQCNCTYWHGAFGGIYLPHLRNAVYHELIQAENRLEILERGRGSWVAGKSEDFDFDLRNEVCLSNDKFAAYFAPARGGMMYELDVRSVAHNLLAGMRRRPESYHRRVLQGSAHSGDAVSSIHDRIVCKQPGLDARLQYDDYPRKSFLEHFYDNDVSFDAIVAGNALERGDFVAQEFEAKLRRGARKVQLQLARDGNAWGIPIRMTKAVTVEAGSSVLNAVYLLEGLPRDRQLHLALEWHFAGMPSSADDRFFYNAEGESLGHLGTQLELEQTQQLGLIDTWQGLDVLLTIDRPASIWTFPIETVSQSEAGFELVHQSVCVMPHWLIQGDAQGRWSTQLQFNIANSHHPSVLAQQVTQVTILGAS